jgi:hypothetical protein
MGTETPEAQWQPQWKSEHSVMSRRVRDADLKIGKEEERYRCQGNY